MSASAAASRAASVPASLPGFQRASPVATRCCLLAADISVILLARRLGATLWSLVNSSIRTENEFDLWMSLGLFLLVYAGFGLYSAARLGAVEELRRIVLGAALVSLVLTAAAFLSKTEGVYSRGVFLCSGILVAVLAPLQRACIRRFFAAKGWWGVPVVILGAGETARLLIEDLRSRPEIGMKPVACLDDDIFKLGECAGVPVLGSLTLAPELARALHIHHAIVAMPGVPGPRLVSIVERCGTSFSNVIMIPNLLGMATLWVSIREMGGLLGLEVRQNLLIPFNRWLKRTMDVTLGLALGIVAIPIVAAAALWIKLLSRGPALYYQVRGGEAGRAIHVWKLRTMCSDAESVLSGHLLQFPEAREEWQRYFKLRKDPRILPGIGTLLRRTSLDELPQLWNVLRGDMSLVGPRPFPEYHLARFPPEFRNLRARVTPGLTGLWQVAARSNGDLKTQEALDTYYIRNWSPWLDLHILARTVRALISCNGAY
jgi:Undecaprenyl-phosphate galactose phosphotransferase WbaP